MTSTISMLAVAGGRALHVGDHVEYDGSRTEYRGIRGVVEEVFVHGDEKRHEVAFGSYQGHPVLRLTMIRRSSLRLIADQYAAPDVRAAA